MALRVVEGAGHLLLVVAVPTLMAGVAAPRDRGLVMGIWATFFGVGFSLSALLIGQSASAAYLVHGALASGLGVILWRMLPRGIGTAARPLPRLSDHLMIYRTPSLFAPALGHGIYALMFLALVTYVPGALSAPWLSPVLPLVGLIGSLGAGVLARVVSPGLLVSGGFAAMAALFALVALAGPLAPWVAIIALTVSGVVAGGGFAAVPWLNPGEADRALSNGALAQLGNIGTFAGTPILAALGAQAAVPFAITIGLIGALATGLAYRAAAQGRACE